MNRIYDLAAARAGLSEVPDHPYRHDQGEVMREISEIIIHCTATRPDWMAAATTAEKVEEVRRWHVQDRGWRDIGYHWLIDRDGRIAAGRPVEQTGAHVAGHNTGTIGISLIGGHGSAATDAFAEHFTPAQNRALRGLIAKLRQDFPGIGKVTGHNDYAAKACPGFRVAAWLGATAAPAPTVPAQKPGGLAAWLAALITAIFGGRK